MVISQSAKSGHIKTFISCMLAGVSGFDRQGPDPVEGTGGRSAFLDGAVSSSAEPRPQQFFCLPSRATLAFSDLRPGARPPSGSDLGSRPALGTTAGSGSAAGAGPAASGARGAAGSQQPALALPAAPDQAVHAPGSSSAPSAAVPDQAALVPSGLSSAGAAADAPAGSTAQPAAAPAAAEPAGGVRSRKAGAAVDRCADVPGSGVAAGPGGGGRGGDPGAREPWRFSLRGLFDAMGVDLFMQAVGSNVDPATVDKVVSAAAGPGDGAKQQLLGKLPVEVQTQLLDPTAPGKLVRMLQTLEAMGLIAAEARACGAPAGVPPASALTYVAAAQIELEEPEDLADPKLLGEPLGVLARAPAAAAGGPVPPGAPEAQPPPEELVRGGFRRRRRVYDLREAGALERYWARLEILCTLWCACQSLHSSSSTLCTRSRRSISVASLTAANQFAAA